jgi:hypothetical protein
MSTTTIGATSFKLWVPADDNKKWHIEHGDNPIFDAVFAELGDPYREPVIAMKNPKKKVDLKEAAEKIKTAGEVMKSSIEKIPTRTRTEEVTIEFAKLRKMTRPQLLSYIATNRPLLPVGMKPPTSQARKAELLNAAQHIARAKF